MGVIETCTKEESSWRALFHGSLFRLLPPHERLALKMEVRPFVWITVDATLDYIAGVSWHDHECFRLSIEDCKRMCGVDSDVLLKIGECEMLADALAIFLWGIKEGVVRNIILCTGNRNVFHLMKKGKAKQGKYNRILKVVMDFTIRHNVEVSPQYLRSAHNITADGLARWTDQEIMEWLHRERMWQVDVPPEWMQTLDLVDDVDEMAVHAARIRGKLMDFLRDGRNKVCEWRPGCFTTASLMWDWRAPCWAYGIVRPVIFAMVDFHVQVRASEDDIFLLIGCAYSQLEIDGFKRDVNYVRPRYAILITPSWV